MFKKAGNQWLINRKRVDCIYYKVTNRYVNQSTVNISNRLSYAWPLALSCDVKYD